MALPRNGKSARALANAKDGIPKMPRQCLRGSDRGNYQKIDSDRVK